MPRIALVLCTYNPHPPYLARTLEAIRGQTLPQAEWEFVLVDNRSDIPLAGRIDIAWHAGARIAREDTPGLNAARRRGLAESTAPLIVFADDDNVLEPGYLAEALRIAETHPHLGAWGGRCLPEFEVEPASHLAPFLPNLALRDVTLVRWANHGTETCPFGAGMCVRRAVTETYARHSADSALRMSFGRKGASLASGEDLDLALTAHDMGLGTGLFPSLGLVHLIAARRVTEDYLRRITIECVLAYYLVASVHGIDAQLPPAPRRKKRGYFRRWLDARRGKRIASPHQLALEEAQARARAILQSRPADSTF